jgi:cyclopropane-fatty-acyl-phospholipid synthase
VSSTFFPAIREGSGVAATGGPTRGAAAHARLVLARLAGGCLAALPVTLRFWDGSELCAPADRPSAGVLHVRREAVGYFLRQPNQLGLARAYVAGALDLDGDPAVLLAERHRFEPGRRTRVMRRLAAAYAAVIAGPSVIRAGAPPATEARPGGRLHTPARDRRAVRHHYDVSNAFYRRLLGPSLVYSCAYFAASDEGLERAQQRKLELICRKLQLEPGERLLDIGCGWGSLIIHAARHHGVRAVGVTLSEPQAELARERIRGAGLADVCEVRVADYREIDDGPYDKIASVGMYEHVGSQNLPVYAAAVARLLRPGGLALNHGISRLYSKPPKGGTFINRFVFPDGELPPVTEVIAALQQAGLETRDVESLREHYVLTLRRWLANLEASRDEAVAEIGAERERIWRLYLTASALGFEDGDITVYQVLTAHRGAPHALPLERAALLSGA